MKKSLLLIISSVFLTLNLQAQSPTIEWEKCYGGINSDKGYDIMQTPEGNYILCGAVGFVSKQVSSKILVNSSGTILQSWGGSSAQNPGAWYDVESDGSGNYATAGYISTGGSNELNNYQVNTAFSLGGVSNDNGRSLTLTLDNGFLVVGDSYSSDGDVTGHHGTTDSSDIWVVKTDNLGYLVWQKSLRGTGSEIGHDVKKTSDGGYIIAGSSTSNNGDLSENHGLYDIWVVKIDNSANIEWQKSFGGAHEDMGAEIYNDELYAAGAFEGVWSTKTKKVISKLNGTGKWNGENWTPISNEAANSYVKEMITYKGDLYSSKFKGTLVYDIDNMFPKRMNYNLGKYTFSIHKSDGSVWVPIPAQPVAKGLTYLAVYKDALYVAAWVEKEGKGQCIMRWDGSTWTTIAKMGDLVLRDNAYNIQSMYVYNDELIVSGSFNMLDGKEIKYMAKYKE